MFVANNKYKLKAEENKKTIFGKTNEKLEEESMGEKNEKGITLIALVITVIVLLILAGVAIATLTGENGILSKTDTAKQETTKQEVKEKVQVEVLRKL